MLSQSARRALACGVQDLERSMAEKPFVLLPVALAWPDLSRLLSDWLWEFVSGHWIMEKKLDLSWV